MTGADEETQSRRAAGLGDSSQRTISRPRGGRGVLTSQLVGRWKILGTILVSAITTVALYQVDETLTLDVWAFGFLTVVLALYTLLTLRSDLKIE